MNPAILDFDDCDLAPKAIQVKYGGKQYLLTEASAEAVRLFKNAQFNAGRLSEDGVSASTIGLQDSETLLVSLCLFLETEKGRQPVALGVVRSWPNRHTQRLYDWVVTASDLNIPDSVEGIDRLIARFQARRKQLLRDGGESAVKNGQGATAVTSA